LLRGTIVAGKSGTDFGAFRSQILALSAPLVDHGHEQDDATWQQECGENDENDAQGVHEVILACAHRANSDGGHVWVVIAAFSENQIRAGEETFAQGAESSLPLQRIGSHENPEPESEFSWIWAWLKQVLVSGFPLSEVIGNLL